MTYPSVKRLQACLHIDAEIARKVRALMKGEMDPCDVPQCAQWVRQCHHEPPVREKIMCAIDGLLDTHGVEALGDSGTYRYPQFSYCNTGDSYACTVVYDYLKDRYLLTSWGDLVEGGKVRGES